MHLPFLQVPIILPGNENEPEKEVMARVQPEQVQCYYEGYHFGCMIYFIGGHVAMTRRSVKELDFAFGNYWKQVEANENKPNFLLNQ